MFNDGPLQNMRWVPIRPAANTAAFEVVQANAAELVGGVAVLDVIQPDGNGTTYLINGPEDIAAGKLGRATLAIEYPVFAAYDSGDGTPAFGETWGPVAGSSVLHKGMLGYRVIYPHTNNRVLVLRDVVSARSYGGCYGTGSKACSAGSWTAIDFGGSEHATTDDLDLGTAGKIVFLAAGTYRIRGEVTAFSQGSGGPTNFKAQLLQNTSGVGPIMESHTYSSGIAGYCGVTAVLEMTANDYVRIQVDGDVDVKTMSLVVGRD